VLQITAVDPLAQRHDASVAARAVRWPAARIVVQREATPAAQQARQREVGGPRPAVPTTARQADLGVTGSMT